ncbi:MAG: hypothetical protein AAFN93_25485, partial [Bacteroidota bacterium]
KAPLKVFDFPFLHADSFLSVMVVYYISGNRNFVFDGLDRPGNGEKKKKRSFFRLVTVALAFRKKIEHSFLTDIIKQLITRNSIIRDKDRDSPSVKNISILC